MSGSHRVVGMRNRARSILPRRVWSELRSMRQGTRALRAALRERYRRSFEWLGRTRWGSHIYYSMFSPAFIREHHAVLYGRMKYREDVRSGRGEGARLRRNTHRLEKGLISRPQRQVFAVDYIEETVESYEVAMGAQPGDDLEELAWSRDVLRSYFARVGPHPRIDAARERFEACSVARPAEGTKQPYLRDLRAASPVEFEALLQLARRRRSVRWFLPTPVDRALVDKAMLVATQAPSACNRQPFQFRIYDDPEMVQRVASCAGGSRGFRENFPMIAVVVGRQRAYFDERDRHVIYIDGALAAMSFALALETLGLSSCMINWPDVESQERALARLLRLEPDERPVMQIAVGYPDPSGAVPYSGKKSLSRIRRYNDEQTETERESVARIHVPR